MSTFKSRHIGVTPEDRAEMLSAIGVESADKLIEETIPGDIRLRGELDLPRAIDEYTYLRSLKEIARKNQLFTSYIGMGYHDCVVPSVILRNLFENPGWYTAYTPYQAEIAQGRLEALLNFQTMVCDLTGMEIANASLLDEGTAAAEAMAMLYRLRSRDLVKRDASVFWVADNCHPQTIEVLKTRAEPLGIELRIGDLRNVDFSSGNLFGLLLQYPGTDGEVCDYSELIGEAHSAGALVSVAADLLSLVLLKSPGAMGADAVVGSAQRFGVPMGYGGPHAAFFATREDFKRQVPGRIIGVSIDRHGNPAFRMALQTREQHIRREKATSNICTAQTLLANMAGMYAAYHGLRGLREIAGRVHRRTVTLAAALVKLGLHPRHTRYFDTLTLEVDPDALQAIRKQALEARINLRYSEDRRIGISLNETTSADDVRRLVRVFAAAAGKQPPAIDEAPESTVLNGNYLRKDQILTHPVFNMYHTETKMMRYLKHLEIKDLSLTTSMIPLGSCTMKLNAASELMPVSWPEFADMHPFAPLEQAGGYARIFRELEAMLCEITGLAAVSLQPNSGAQGEFTGMLVIDAYHRDRGEAHRDVVLIPSSAHGTNPASAIMCGKKVVIVKCDDHGNIDVDDLRAKAEKHAGQLSALMVTYPSTHGVFEPAIREICRIIHDHGGQVYMDGANMNAQVGLTNPALIGADVCHLNLHKTFSIPHGGGGPGMGPICVAAHLAPFLPGHIDSPVGGEKAISAVATAPRGSASILLISYAYIRLLGPRGVTEATHNAILNANYLKARLETYFPVLYAGKNGRVGHELIFDIRPFKASAGIDVEDIAKRLVDYGFHAPTISFPVVGTLMVEPTESESKDELDRFCEAMIAIYREIEAIKSGEADPEDNVIKNAPHTAAEALSDNWQHPYGREAAVFPADYLRVRKYWPPVARIDNAYGDRNLFCVCPPPEAYEETD